jgi:hypothetical protein
VTPDSEILAFAIRWLPFGRAPIEDMFVTFGLTQEKFRERLADALRRERPRMAPPTVRALVESYQL